MVNASEFICWFPHCCTLSNLGVWHIYGIRGAYLLLVHVWQWYGNIKLHFAGFFLICAVMLGLYAAYNRHTVGHAFTVWQAYCLGAYSNNVKYMLSSVSVTLLIVVSSY